MRRKVVVVAALLLLGAMANAKQTLLLSCGGHKRTLTVMRGHRRFLPGDRFHFNGEIWTVLR